MSFSPLPPRRPDYLTELPFSLVLAFFGVILFLSFALLGATWIVMRIFG